MNAQVNKDQSFSQRAALQALGLILETQAETLDQLKAEAERIASGKAAKKDIDTDGSGLWGLVRTVTEAVDNATADHNNVKLARHVLAAALEDVQGEAAATLKSYAATAGKVLELVRAGKLAWATMPEEYNKVRDAMKPDHKKALDAQAKDINKAIKRIKRHKLPSKASEALAALIEACERFAIEADASREEAKAGAKAAKELDALRQQHPSAPATVEVSAAA